MFYLIMPIWAIFIILILNFWNISWCLHNETGFKSNCRHLIIRAHAWRHSGGILLLQGDIWRTQVRTLGWTTSSRREANLDPGQACFHTPRNGSLFWLYNSWQIAHKELWGTVLMPPYLAEKKCWFVILSTWILNRPYLSRFEDELFWIAFCQTVDRKNHLTDTGN